MRTAFFSIFFIQLSLFSSLVGGTAYASVEQVEAEILNNELQTLKTEFKDFQIHLPGRNTDSLSSEVEDQEVKEAKLNEWGETESGEDSVNLTDEISEEQAAPQTGPQKKKRRR